jgi:hypothetical protein
VSEWQLQDEFEKRSRSFCLVVWVYDNFFLTYSMRLPPSIIPKDLKKDTVSGVKIDTDPENPNHLIGTITGPDDTPYARGVFKVDMIIPPDYPFSPPKCKFITRCKPSFPSTIYVSMFQRMKILND